MIYLGCLLVGLHIYQHSLDHLNLFLCLELADPALLGTSGLVLQLWLFRCLGLPDAVLVVGLGPVELFD